MSAKVKKFFSESDYVFFVIGSLVCYIPLYMLTRMAAKGLFPSLHGEGLSSFEILPLYAIGNIVANTLFYWVSGWWKNIPITKVWGVKIPKVRWYIWISGLCITGQIFAAIWAYTFQGISIVFVALILKGGVLILAPTVDIFVKSRKKNSCFIFILRLRIFICTRLKK